MRKLIRFECVTDNNIIVQSAIIRRDGVDFHAIEINVGETITELYGQDGESIFFELDEFDQFVNQCIQFSKDIKKILEVKEGS